MKNEIACPVCGLMFSPKTPYTHIQQHHSGAKDSELAKIRDARRKCFDELPERKKGDRRCLPQVAVFAAGHRDAKKPEGVKGKDAVKQWKIEREISARA